MMKLVNFQKNLVLVALCYLPGTLLAGEFVEKSLSAQPNGIVEIHNVRGDIKVLGWDKQEVEIRGELDDLAEELIFEKQGKVTLIRVKMPNKNVNHGDGSKLVINIPNGNRLDFSGVSTDLIIKNIDGGIDIRTVSGDVDGKNIHKQLFVTTVSGDIEFKDSSGRAKLGTVSGDIEGNLNSQGISANSVSGDVELELTEFDELSASTVSGDLKIEGKLKDDGEASLNNVSGDITLKLASKVNARANIKSGPGGSITNGLSSDKVKEIFPNQQKLQMTLGDGSGRIKIYTVSGSIRLSGKNH